MVFFACNACGESLKKAQVDKHVAMCRGCQVLSCIDCGKDFWGDDYKNHVKCISEDQKYGGKGYEAKSNKGDMKQQQWIQRIHDAMNKPGISTKLKDVLNQVSMYDNVPRKKAKFQNWMRNSLRISGASLQDEVWNIFSEATSNIQETTKSTEVPKQTAAEVKVEICESQEENGFSEKKKKVNKREHQETCQKKNRKVKKGAEKSNTEEVEEEQTYTKKKKNKKRKGGVEEDGNGEENGHSRGDETSRKKRKKSREVCEDDQKTDEAEVHVIEETEEQAASKGKFSWNGTIKAVLKQTPEQELSVKKLRKKILAAYYSFSGDSNFKSEVELLALFNKKINGNPKFKVLKEKVILIK
ncbi:cell growth-regulating nucleolar protein [Lampris incognitus]|uniref:cell growth-regulating nucleolar protein n=1 Tax=Lampris incognitus TaxID=2546036 RepID=UPI0024B5FB87|nr:cell growth-regulating nucleolar protein [Lampris incognitus]